MSKKTMSQQESKRRLLSRLGRQFAYTAPALALAASGLAMQAHADDTQGGYSQFEDAPHMLAEAHSAEGGAEGEGEHDEEGEGEGEGEGSAEGSPEAG
ncbi:MAG: hypothetical protein FMJ08_10765 [Halomonas sp.]|nr:hypothetical protein [Halomonas sp.]TVM04968.1 MAG: hypothetical protein FMJ08_10765 [Halomonas sp.]